MTRREDSFDQGERWDTLPGPGAERRADGEWEGREMRSRNDGAKRAVIYVRVASMENGLQQQAMWQEEACREAAIHLGLKVVGVYSQAGTYRHMLHRMLDDFPVTKATHVITLNPSRFTRSHDYLCRVREWLFWADVETVYAQGVIW